MRNTFIIILFVLVGAICLLIGLYLGTNFLAADKITLAKQQSMQAFADKVKNLPGMNIIPATDGGIVYGTIKAITGKQLTITTEARTVDDLLNGLPKDRFFTATDTTKIFYLKLADGLFTTADPNSLITEELIAISDLNIGDQVSILIDPNEALSPTATAIEIKVNR